VNPSNGNIDLSSPEKDSEFERVFEGLQRANPTVAEPEPGRERVLSPHLLITSGNLLWLRQVENFACGPSRDERFCTFPSCGR